MSDPTTITEIGCGWSNIHSMRIYKVSANYLQLKDNNQNKGLSMYIDGRPKASGNIAGFINSTKPRSTNEQPNCVFEGREGNRVFVCSIKSIVVGEELMINYNLNRIDINIVIMGVVNITFHQTCN
jgi:hypothetical protein